VSNKTRFNKPIGSVTIFDQFLRRYNLEPLSSLPELQGPGGAAVAGFPKRPGTDPVKSASPKGFK
jgi:hypothetical protein